MNSNKIPIKIKKEKIELKMEFNKNSSEDNPNGVSNDVYESVVPPLKKEESTEVTKYEIIIDVPKIDKKKNKEEIFCCTQCPYTSPKKHALKVHMLYKHTPDCEIQYYQCQLCDYKAKLNYDLTKHTRNIHTPRPSKIREKSVPCTQCNDMFTNNANLKKHMIYKHTPEDQIKYYDCHFCDYKAKIKSDLLPHIKNVHFRITKIKEKKYKCTECPYSCTKKANLAKHIIYKHTPDEEVQFYYCANCKYKAKIKTNLLNHIQHVHMKEIRKRSKRADLFIYNLNSFPNSMVP